MPVSDSEKEILFHQPANLNQTPDSADPKKKVAPPARQVLRPSSEAPLSDVIRHQPASPGSEPAAEQPNPEAAAAAEASANAEFAAAAARARAAINQQRRNTAARGAATQMPPQNTPKPRHTSAAPAQPAPAQPAPAQPTPTQPAPAQPAPTQQAPARPQRAAPRRSETSASAAAVSRAPAPARAAWAPSCAPRCRWASRA